ncbi:MAG: hypothetical protein AAFR98_00405 [Pseudomonadota bacterium]
MRLILHLGPPKTATSFLQNKVFRFLKGIDFLEKGHLETVGYQKGSIRDLRRYLSEEKSWRAITLARAANQYLRHLRQSAHRTVLISNENLTTTEYRLFVSRGSTPSQVANRLHLLAKRGGFEQLDVIIAQRRADHLLASRYAQGAHRQTYFNQTDFDRRLARILRRGADWRHYRWLKNDAAVDKLRSALGSNHVHQFDFDAFQSRPKAEVEKLIAFIDPSQAGLMDRLASVDPDLFLPINDRKLTENTWRLARTEEQIVLSEQTAEALRRTFGF